MKNKISAIVVGGVLLAGLGGYAGVAAVSNSNINANAAAPAAVSDPKPGPEKGDPAGPSGGPAYERGKGAIQPIKRGNDGGKRVPMLPAKFGGTAKYSDGVELTTGGFQRGVVTDEGAGIIKGAEFVVITVAVANGSKDALDLTAVVPTMIYGSDKVPAAPLYDGVEVADFSEKVAAGASASATYAFQVPADAVSPELHLDLDGVHDPATFTGELP